jgi:tRNA dimethylallyltransferase
MSSDAPDTRPPVVVIAGPTAAGKTGLAIELAERFGGEIVNADSMQVYRHLDIGTAKPGLAERARVPHHLLDVVAPDEPYSAGRFVRDARAAVAAIHARGRPAFVVGGTGLYVRALLEGLTPGGGADPALRARWEERDRQARERGDPGWLHRQLAERDPDRAAALHPNDVRRIVRALELCERTGASASHLAGSHAFGDRPYRVLHLAADPGREALDRRIDARCDAMIEAGLLREVRELRRRGYGPELRPLQAIGYRHVMPVVDGVDTLANAAEAMKRDTRRFARRQRTWLRGLEDVHWVHPEDTDAVHGMVGRFLAESEAAGWRARLPSADPSSRTERSALGQGAGRRG